MTIDEAKKNYASAKALTRNAEAKCASSKRDYEIVCSGDTNRYRGILADDTEAELVARKMEADAASVLADVVLNEGTGF